jgi:single-stranded-DNA-specific exonuclease
LKPFGTGNPEPVFMAKDIKVLSQKIVGKNHRQMILQQDANSTAKRFRAIQFNVDPLNIIDERIEKMAFHLRWNYWNGDKIVQIVVGEI